VWGLGALLHRSLAGGGPFHGQEPRYPQLEMRAPAIRSLRRVPAAVAEAVDACLEPDPAERPALHELSDVLDEAA
jgi:hypothetical protein